MGGNQLSTAYEADYHIDISKIEPWYFYGEEADDKEVKKQKIEMLNRLA